VFEIVERDFGITLFIGSGNPLDIAFRLKKKIVVIIGF
jgi:hypothetical protein